MGPPTNVVVMVKIMALVCGKAARGPQVLANSRIFATIATCLAHQLGKTSLVASDLALVTLVDTAKVLQSRRFWDAPEELPLHERMPPREAVAGRLDELLATLARSVNERLTVREYEDIAALLGSFSAALLALPLADPDGCSRRLGRLLQTHVINAAQLARPVLVNSRHLAAGAPGGARPGTWPLLLGAAVATALKLTVQADIERGAFSALLQELLSHPSFRALYEGSELGRSVFELLVEGLRAAQPEVALQVSRGAALAQDIRAALAGEPPRLSCIGAFPLLEALGVDAASFAQRLVAAALDGACSDSTGFAAALASESDLARQLFADVPDALPRFFADERFAAVAFSSPGPLRDRLVSFLLSEGGVGVPPLPVLTAALPRALAGAAAGLTDREVEALSALGGRGFPGAGLLVHALGSFARAPDVRVASSERLRLSEEGRTASVSWPVFRGVGVVEPPLVRPCSVPAVATAARLLAETEATPSRDELSRDEAPFCQAALALAKNIGGLSAIDEASLNAARRALLAAALSQETNGVLIPSVTQLPARAVATFCAGIAVLTADARVSLEDGALARLLAGGPGAVPVLQYVLAPHPAIRGAMQGLLAAECRAAWAQPSLYPRHKFSAFVLDLIASVIKDPKDCAAPSLDAHTFTALGVFATFGHISPPLPSAQLLRACAASDRVKLLAVLPGVLRECAKRASSPLRDTVVEVLSEIPRFQGPMPSVLSVLYARLFAACAREAFFSLDMQPGAGAPVPASLAESMLAQTSAALRSVQSGATRATEPRPLLPMFVQHTVRAGTFIILAAEATDRVGSVLELIPRFRDLALTAALDGRELFPQHRARLERAAWSLVAALALTGFPVCFGAGAEFQAPHARVVYSARAVRCQTLAPQEICDILSDVSRDLSKENSGALSFCLAASRFRAEGVWGTAVGRERAAVLAAALRTGLAAEAGAHVSPVVSGLIATFGGNTKALRGLFAQARQGLAARALLHISRGGEAASAALAVLAVAALEEPQRRTLFESLALALPQAAPELLEGLDLTSVGLAALVRLVFEAALTAGDRWKDRMAPGVLRLAATLAASPSLELLRGSRMLANLLGALLHLRTSFEPDEEHALLRLCSHALASSSARGMRVASAVLLLLAARPRGEAAAKRFKKAALPVFKAALPVVLAELSSDAAELSATGAELFCFCAALSDMPGKGARMPTHARTQLRLAVRTLQALKKGAANAQQ